MTASIDLTAAQQRALDLIVENYSLRSTDRSGVRYSTVSALVEAGLAKLLVDKKAWASSLGWGNASYSLGKEVHTWVVFPTDAGVQQASPAAREQYFSYRSTLDIKES